MNFADYIIGLGLGVVVTLILRAVSDARREKNDRSKKFTTRAMETHYKVFESYYSNENLHKRIDSAKERIEKLESELWNNPELKHIKRKR